MSSAKRIPYVCSTRNPIGLWYHNWACLWIFDPWQGKMKIRSTRNFKSNVRSISAWIIYVLTKINMMFYSCLEQCEVPLQGFPDCSYLVIKSPSCFCQKQYVQLPKGDYFFCIPPLLIQDLPRSIWTSSSLSAALVSLVVRPWLCKLMPRSAVLEKPLICILPGGILFCLESRTRFSLPWVMCFLSKELQMQIFPGGGCWGALGRSFKELRLLIHPRALLTGWHWPCGFSPWNSQHGKPVCDGAGRHTRIRRNVYNVLGIYCTYGVYAYICICVMFDQHQWL